MVHDKGNQKGYGNDNENVIQHSSGSKNIASFFQNGNQLPTGITDGVHYNGFFLPVTFQTMNTVLLSNGQLRILLGVASVDFSNLGMINQFSPLITEIKIPFSVNLIQLFHHSLNHVVVHVYQKHTAVTSAVKVKFHHPTQRNDPVGTVGRVVKKILHMGQRKMQVFHLLYRFPIPILFRYLSIFLLCGNGYRRNVFSLGGKKGNGNQTVPMGFIQKIHFLIQLGIIHIRALNHIVIKGIGNSAHAKKVFLQLNTSLL